MSQETERERKLRLFLTNPDGFYRPPLHLDIALTASSRRMLKPFLTEVDVYEEMVDAYAAIKQEDIEDSLEPGDSPYPWTESTSSVEFQDSSKGPVMLFAEQLSPEPGHSRVEEATFDVSETTYLLKRDRIGLVNVYVNRELRHLEPEETRDLVGLLHRMLAANAR